jgi:hypothetical protein
MILGLAAFYYGEQDYAVFVIRCEEGIWAYLKISPIE